MVFTLPEDTDAEVRLANGIVIIAFKQAGRRAGRPHRRCRRPAMSARRGATPTAPRCGLRLIRKVTVNTMAAGEKLFVDLLPEGWGGLPPGLPQEVVDDLARRAREAEKKARGAATVARQRSCRRCACGSARNRPSRATCSRLPALIAVAVEPTTRTR